MTVTATPITLYTRRWPMIGYLLLAVGFVAGGIWMGRSGEWIGYLIAAFFGLGIPVFLIQMIPGAGSLHIDADGFTIVNLFRKSSHRWSDVEEFYVVTLRHHGLKTHEMVGLTYAPAYDRSRTARSVAKAISGCEGALPDTYGKRAAELAEMLNARLQESRGRSNT